MIGIRSKWNKMAADKDLKDVRSTILNPFCHSLVNCMLHCCRVRGRIFRWMWRKFLLNGLVFFIRLPRKCTRHVSSYKLVHTPRKYETVLHVIDSWIFTLFIFKVLKFRQTFYKCKLFVVVRFLLFGRKFGDGNQAGGQHPFRLEGVQMTAVRQAICLFPGLGGGGRGGFFPCYPATYLFNRDSFWLFLLIKKMPDVGFDPWSAVPGFMYASCYVLLAYTQCPATLLTVLSSSVPWFTALCTACLLSVLPVLKTLLPVCTKMLLPLPVLHSCDAFLHICAACLA